MTKRLRNVLLRTLCILLFVIPNLSAIGQRTISYEHGEAFAIQKRGNHRTTQLLLGSTGKVVYNSLAKTYLVTWFQKDGISQEMRFRPIGKLSDLTFFEEQMGNHYVIDTQNLDTEGIFLALQVDLKTNTVSDKGLLVIKLKRTNR